MTTQSVNTKLFSVLKDFSTISLEELNATMSLMERIEKKYIIDLKDLGSIMKQLHQDYYVLSIKNNSIFTYDNIYMDTDDFLFFKQHERGQNSRMKVRTREYVDSNIAFFECKQREGELIRKSRYGLPVAESKLLTNQSAAFYESTCISLNLDHAHESLKPTIRTLYKRITLCSKKNDERITIDFDVQVQDIMKDHTQLIQLGPVAIIETKSSHNKSKSHQLIEKFGYKEAQGCSKYCLGVLYTENIKTTKRFKETMDFIEKTKKPIRKVQTKTTQKLSTIKKSIVSDIKHPDRTTTSRQQSKSLAKDPILA